MRMWAMFSVMSDVRGPSRGGGGESSGDIRRPAGAQLIPVFVIAFQNEKSSNCQSWQGKILQARGAFLYWTLLEESLHFPACDRVNKQPPRKGESE